MNFLYPAFLIGAALVAIPIVLHLLRRDVAPPRPFTAVRLLRRSPIERSRRRRLRDLLLLAARIAGLLLLAAAFARPYFAGDAASASVHIVAIDRSFSMGAPGRFARALDLARAAIDEAGGARVAVVAFDDRATVVAAPGGAADARAALGDLQPGFGATRYAPVLLKAAELAEEGAGTLTIVTDLQRAGWEEQARGVMPAGLELRIADAGAPPANLALIGARADEAGLTASIRNGAQAARAGDVRVLRDGRVVASARFTAPADGSVEVPIGFRRPAGGSIVLAIDDPSGFAADNSWFVSLEPSARPAALVVTSGMASGSGFYLTRAIDAAARSDAGDAFESKAATGAQVSPMSGADLSRYRAVVLLSTRGLDRRARGPLAAFVRDGGGLLVAASPDVEPSVLSMIFNWQPALSSAEQPTKAALSVTDLRHPIFAPFGGLVANLGQVRFERSWRVKPEGWDVVARFTDGTPALLERAEGSGRVLLFASDLDRRWNDFPLHPSFVPFAVEALHHAAGARDNAREYVVGRVPDGVRAAPGVYPLADRVVAVNVDPREGTTARVTEEEFRDLVEVVSAGASAPADARAQQAEARQGYWRYALMLMLGVLVVESFVGRA